MTEPIPTPSALMLLAVQGYQHPRIDAAKDYLRRSALSFRERSSPGDLEHLGWAKLALGAHGEDVGGFDQPIRDAYAFSTADGRPLSLVRHALTALALSAEKGNPFFCLMELRRPTSFDSPPVDARDHEDIPAMRPGFFGRIKAKFHGVVVRGIEAMRAPPAFGSVHIAAANSYEDDLVAVLKKQFEHYRPYVPLGGKRIVLKPNLVEWHRDKVINTTPRPAFSSGTVIGCAALEGATDRRR